MQSNAMNGACETDQFFALHACCFIDSLLELRLQDIELNVAELVWPSFAFLLGPLLLRGCRKDGVHQQGGQLVLRLLRDSLLLRGGRILERLNCLALLDYGIQFAHDRGREQPLSAQLLLVVFNLQQVVDVLEEMENHRFSCFPVVVDPNLSQPCNVRSADRDEQAKLYKTERHKEREHNVNAIAIADQHQGQQR